MLAVIAAVFVAAVVLTLNLGRPGPSVIVIERNPLLDQPAPDFRLQTVDGGSVALSDLRGRPVIVNFWASWCVPCREEFPLLRQARERHRSDGLEILGIIHDDGPQAAAAFADRYDAEWPLLLDPDDAVWQAYHGALLPITYYVDRRGIVRAVSYGPPPSGVLDEQLAKIL